MNMIGRQMPGLESSIMFTDDELKFLKAYAYRYHFKRSKDLGGAIDILARFGGYRARKSDGPPGHQIMKRSLESLASATVGYQ